MNVFVVNAFTKERFGGNPAAVVPLEVWPNEVLMQEMAAQHNLAETAFVVRQASEFSIRWFTPTMEVDLCGHATLAAAHVYFNDLGWDGTSIVFQSKSGPLSVTREADGRLSLDFPSLPAEPLTIPDALTKGIGLEPRAAFASRFDLLALLDKQREIEQLIPDFNMLSTLPFRGVIVTARGEDKDFVSRCFFPQSGINEDPVTGSAHCVLAPFWAQRLGKSKLSAAQLSRRKGTLDCEYLGDRTLIRGYAVTYLTGLIVP